MPELPEVEHERRVFARHGTGRTVADVLVPEPAIVRNASRHDVAVALRHRRFGDPDRRGKWLLCPAGGPTLVLHFGMTGGLVWSTEVPERHPHDRLILVLDGGDELRYRDMRKLGGVWLARSPGDLEEILGDLGPDALAVTEEDFLSRLARRRGRVKAALMDQTFLAGVGNLLADEILWQARLHPRAPVERLSPRRGRELYRVLHAVLGTAVEDFDYWERHPEWFQHVRGAGAVCPRCGARLRQDVVAGRTTYWCARCQRVPATPPRTRPRGRPAVPRSTPAGGR